VVTSQTLSFKDFYSINLDIAPEEIELSFKFSKDWEDLDKYIEFSTNHFDAETLLVDAPTIKIPKQFLIAPGLLFYCYGHPKIGNLTERLSTNFLPIRIRGRF
jgi:hypothetical protein